MASLRRQSDSAIVEVMENGMLGGKGGNGDTIEEATSDLARSLAGNRVAIGAYGPDRKNVDVPNDFRHEVKPPTSELDELRGRLAAAGADPRHYSGPNSSRFWDRINALPHKGDLYSCGVMLQNQKAGCCDSWNKQRKPLIPTNRRRWRSDLLLSAGCADRRAMRIAHGTPNDFADKVMAAVGTWISEVEAVAAIAKYSAEYAAAPELP